MAAIREDNIFTGKRTWAQMETESRNVQQKHAEIPDTLQSEQESKGLRQLGLRRVWMRTHDTLRAFI